MTEFIDPEERTNFLVRRMRIKFVRRFIEVVGQLKERFSIPQLERLLEAGNVEEALRFAEVSAVRLGGAWSEAFITAGEETGAFIGSKLEVPVNFNSTNQRALDALQRNNLRLVREFSNEQRLSTRTALNSGIRRGANPRVVAREIRDSIGLTSNQVQIVNNYRDALERNNLEALNRKLRDARFDSTVRRAAEAGEPLSAKQVDRMVDRYRQRWINFRAETIARTEALGSVHEGVEEMYDQAVELGQLDPTELERRWNTALDERVRVPAHSAMHGQIRRLGEAFISGQGNRLRRPGDPQAPASEIVRCRCALSTRFTDSAVADLKPGVMVIAG